MTKSTRSETEIVVDPAQTELLKLSKSILEAICAHDERTLEPLVAPDFVFIGESQRLDRRAFLESVSAGGFVAIEYGFESIEVEVLGGTAAAAGIQRVEVELPDGTRAVSRGCFTDLFVKHGAGWRLRLAHSVELT